MTCPTDYTDLQSTPEFTTSTLFCCVKSLDVISTKGFSFNKWCNNVSCFVAWLFPVFNAVDRFMYCVQWIFEISCEYSNRIKWLLQYSIQNEHHYSKFCEYLPSPFFYLFNRMTPIFHLSNHAWQPTKSTNMESSVGPLWPTKYWNSYNRNHNNCGPIKTLNLFNKYLLLVTFETGDNYSIQLEISNNSSTSRFDSIRNEKTLICTVLAVNNCP